MYLLPDDGDYDGYKYTQYKRNKACSFWTKSYIIDYLVLLVIFGIVGVLYIVVDPIRVDVSWIYQNAYEDYAKPYIPLGQNVCSPVACMGTLAVLPSLALVVFFAAVRKDLHELHHGVMCILLYMGISTFLWSAMTRSAGKPRPDFFSRCEYNLADKTCIQRPGLEGDAFNSDLVSDGLTSFPSGHSAFVTAGMTWSLLYLIGKRNIYRGRGNLFVVAWLILTVFVSYWVGYSRIDENRHFVFDVIIGTLLGIASAVITYPVYYPWPFGPTPSRPYSIARPHRAWEYVFGRSTRGDPRYVWEPYAPDESAPTLLVKPIGTGIVGDVEAVNLGHGLGGSDIGDIGDDVEMARTKQPYPESSAPAPVDLKETVTTAPGAVRKDVVAPLGTVSSSTASDSHSSHGKNKATTTSETSSSEEPMARKVDKESSSDHSSDHSTDSSSDA